MLKITQVTETDALKDWWRLKDLSTMGNESRCAEQVPAKRGKRKLWECIMMEMKGR